MCGDTVTVDEPVAPAVRPEVSSLYHDCNLWFRDVEHSKRITGSLEVLRSVYNVSRMLDMMLDREQYLFKIETECAGAGGSHVESPYDTGSNTSYSSYSSRKLRGIAESVSRSRIGLP